MTTFVIEYFSGNNRWHPVREQPVFASKKEAEAYAKSRLGTQLHRIVEVPEEVR